MCKKRELIGDPLISNGHRPIGERSLQILMRKQLTLMALIDKMATTVDTDKGEAACQEIVSIMKELKNMNAACTCGLN